jgi:membrane fusion protein
MSQRPALFRQQAIDFQRHSRQWGGVTLLQPVSSKFMVWLLIASVVVLAVFLALAPYARKETVSGYLMPSAGTARIHAPLPGFVSAIHVSEGQVVAADQPLLSITTSQVSADGQDVNAAILASLQSQRDVLSAQIAAEDLRTASERERLDALIDGLRTEISHMEGQVATQRERIRLSQEFLSAAAGLNPRGYVSDLEVRRREETLLQNRQDLDALQQQVAARRNQVVETRAALQQLPVIATDRLRALSGELAAAEQRIAEVNGRRAYVLRAPIAGRVSSLQATVGQTVDPRRLQLSIVPDGSILQAELFVPTRAAGFVRPGQPVRILYDAFPYQHFGTYQGSVTQISRTVLTAADAAGPVELREPSYRVTATLQTQEVDARGEAIPLQPDMLLRADIILDRRPLMEWLLAPLLGPAIRTMQP